MRKKPRAAPASLNKRWDEYVPRLRVQVPAGTRGHPGVWLAGLQGHTKPVTSMIFSPNGESLLTTSDDGSARVWAARTGKSKFALHSQETDVELAAFSPDGSRVATAGFGSGELWDSDTGVMLSQSRGGPRPLGLGFSPAGPRLVASDLENGTRQLVGGLWDLATPGDWTARASARTAPWW